MRRRFTGTRHCRNGKRFERVDVERFLSLVNQPGRATVLAMGRSLLQDAVRAVLDARPELAGTWVPYTTSLRIGMHSYPDDEFESTAWSGSFSISVYGDGTPQIKALREALERSTQWQALQNALADVLEIDVQTLLVVYS